MSLRGKKKKQIFFTFSKFRAELCCFTIKCKSRKITSLQNINHKDVKRLRICKTFWRSV